MNKNHLMEPILSGDLNRILEDTRDISQNILKLISVFEKSKSVAVLRFYTDTKISCARYKELGGNPEDLKLVLFALKVCAAEKRLLLRSGLNRKNDKATQNAKGRSDYKILKLKSRRSSTRSVEKIEMYMVLALYLGINTSKITIDLMKALAMALHGISPAPGSVIGAGHASVVFRDRFRKRVFYWRKIDPDLDFHALQYFRHIKERVGPIALVALGSWAIRHSTSEKPASGK